MRALIRARRRENESPEEHLRELYRFATLFSLVHPPNRDGGGRTADDVATWEEVEHLELPFAEVGYEKLALLNKTDKKWLVEAWGEPNAHLLPVARRQAKESGTGDPSAPASIGIQEPEAEVEEIYRPTSRAREAEVFAPKPRHKYDGGAVPVPESAEDPVYDLMERLAKPDAKNRAKRKKKLLKRALVITGFSEDG